MPAPLMTSRTFSGLVQLVERQPAAAVIVDSLSVAHARQAVLGMSTPPALIAWRGCYTSQVTAAFIASGADEVLHRDRLGAELAARLRRCTHGRPSHASAAHRDQGLRQYRLESPRAGSAVPCRLSPTRTLRASDRLPASRWHQQRQGRQLTSRRGQPPPGPITDATRGDQGKPVERHGADRESE